MGKEVPRSSGYKPFKRWEWYWENRVLADGSFPQAGFVHNEFEKYLEKHQGRNNGQRTVYGKETPGARQFLDKKPMNDDGIMKNTKIHPHILLRKKDDCFR